MIEQAKLTTGCLAAMLKNRLQHRKFNIEEDKVPPNDKVDHEKIGIIEGVMREALGWHFREINNTDEMDPFHSPIEKTVYTDPTLSLHLNARRIIAMSRGVPDYTNWESASYRFKAKNWETRYWIKMPLELVGVYNETEQ